MSLLQEIKISATRSDVRVADLLRKCLLLAWQLKSKDLEQWVNSELTGYTDDNVPEYRIIFLKNFLANLHNEYTPATNIPVSKGIIVEAFPDDWREIIGPIRNRQSISELEEGLIQVRSSGRGGFQISWSTDQARRLDYKIISTYICWQVWCEIPSQDIARILDNVKTRIMKFANDIEKENPNAGEAKHDEIPIDQRIVSQIIINNFYGSVGNLATGSSNFHQFS